MTNIISLENRIKQKEKEKEQNLNEDSNTKQPSLNINLNKRKTITLSSEEILFLIEMSISYLSDMPDEIENRIFFLKEDAPAIADENGKDVEEVIEEESKNIINNCKNEINLILRNTKKLIDKFFSSQYILDKKIQFSVRDIDIYYDILCKYIDYTDYRIGFDELYKKRYYKKDYDIASDKEKLIKYLYKVFRDMYSEFYPPILNFSEEEISKSEMLRKMKEDRDSYEGILKYYRDNYIKEYKSKLTIICEGFWSFRVNGEQIGPSDVCYYIKPNTIINRRLAKYNRWDYFSNEPNPFEYIDEYYLEEQKEFTDTKDNYPYGVGWRITHKALSEEEFECNDEFIEFYELYEAQREVSKQKFASLKEFEGLDIEILFEEDLEERFDYIPGKIERLLDSLEYLFDDYFSCKYIYDDYKIFDMLEKVTRSFYE